MSLRLCIILTLIAAPPLFAGEEKMLDVLPKDAIRAVLSPTFVDADSAKLSEDAKVIGVEINGEARAYAVNLLNGHEIVNDEIAGRKIAVTW